MDRSTQVGMGHSTQVGMDCMGVGKVEHTPEGMDYILVRTLAHSTCHTLFHMKQSVKHNQP
jgi:hypothetical protein